MNNFDRWRTLAGPQVLGRSILIAPGESAPAPWARVVRIELNERTLGDPNTLNLVRHSYLTRTPHIYEVDPAMGMPTRGMDMREVWEIAPDMDFAAEATWRLARANAINALSIDEPRWPLANAAIRAGASSAGEHYADVTLADGTLAWCDGGPLHLWGRDDPSFDNAVVIPRLTISWGNLTPVRAREVSAPLAPDQLAAVADPSARARVIAPAGSGKTRVLTERARHVLSSGVPANSLLLVAFNKRAQLEMRERTADHPELQIQTLNALSLSIVNGTNGFTSQRVRRQTISERDVRNIISTYVKFPRKTNTDPVAAWIDALTEVRLGLRSPEQVERGYQGDLEGFADFFETYRQHLADNHLVDFDEQVYLAIETLLREPENRYAAERRAEVLLVDEFQDLTPAHMLLIRLLAGPALSIFAVGDDDQTIYGYSGATPEWLVKFEDHVPDAVHHALEVNYRCPAPVVMAASNLLTRNTLRVAKVIRSVPSNLLAPDSLKVAKVEDQVSLVTEHVRSLVDRGGTFSEIAVLSRVNANLVPIQVALIEAGFPVNVRDGGEFLRSSGVESALAWLRLAVQPESLIGKNIELAVRRPGRGISPRVREWMSEQVSIEGLSRLAGRLDESSSSKIDEFVRDLERVSKFAKFATTSDLIEFIRSDVGLDRALATLDASHQGRNSTSNSDGLRSLIALGRQHSEPKTFDGWLKNVLSMASEPSGVTLATVHRVKGLEWPHVIIYDASLGVFPHRLSVDIEEERRVFHVATTRCTKSLVVTADVHSPSVFIGELASPSTMSDRQVEVRVKTGVGRNSLGVNPVPAEVGMRFKWGGYDFTVEVVTSDGVVVSTQGSRSTTLPFGWTFNDGAKNRTLIAPTATRRRRTVSSPQKNIDSDLYAALKVWRREQAKSDAVPAYVIFNDRTLEELSSVRPRTQNDLLAIVGIGPAKVDRYGDQILAVIIEHTDNN